MKGKLPNIISKPWPISAVLSILVLWQLSVSLELVESFMLPSPVQIASAFMKEFPSLVESAGITLVEAGLGLALKIAAGFEAAILMDRFDEAYKVPYPIIMLTQTVPVIAIAPLLVLWFGYEIAPKIILIMITTFLPITVGMLNGLRAVNSDAVNLLKAMGTDRLQVFRYIELSGAMD